VSKFGLESSLNSSLKSSYKMSREGLHHGIDFLHEPGIDVTGDRVSGYEYKHWTPLWIPFIQASSGIWDQDFAVFPAATGILPFTKTIPVGSKWDFQMLTPDDHPFLLLDVKVISTPVGGSRFQTVFDMATQPYLAQKYLFPNNENVITQVIAISPSGKPVWGGVQNVSGMINSAATIGPEPHAELVPLSNTQSNRSGKGALQHGILFPPNGMLKVQVENRRAATSIEVNGACFGYVLME
jgi:hypothetical protein